MSVNTISSGVLQKPLAGLMGLAFTAIASSGATPFWQAATPQFSDPLMSFYLGRQESSDGSSSTDLVANGVFTLGGTNETLFSGDLEFTGLAGSTQDPTFWHLTMASKCFFFLV